MNKPEEKFRISYSLSELKLILSFLSSDPERMMENLEMFQRTDKLIKKIEAGIMTAAFAASPSALSGGGRIGVLASEVKTAKAIDLLQRKEAGQILTPSELEEVVTYKADNKMPLDAEEQQTFNTLMMKKFNF